MFKKIAEDFEIDAAKGEERAEKSLPPAKFCETLAAHKAREIAAKKEHSGKIIVGADTVVAADGGILGKPKDEENAKEMLRRLSGREHSVFTGVCVVFPGGEEIIACEETKVKFKPLCEEFICAYVAGGSPMDKAGAYGIQDGVPTEYVRGSIDNVVGLPTELLKRILREKGAIEK